MKKPLNKVALALWIVAALFVLAEGWTVVEMFRSVTHFPNDTVYLFGGGILRFVESTVTTAGILTAMGVLIELVDQIRWTVTRASEK